MTDRDNTGTLGKNLDKQKPDSNPAWPDYKGRCKIDGQEFWISAWLKENRQDGSKFFSLSFKPKEARTGGQSYGGTKPPPAENDDDGSSVPF